MQREPSRADPNLQIFLFCGFGGFCLRFFGLALGGVGCASRAGRVAIGLMRECPRPVTTHYGSSDVSARSPADLKFGSLSSNSRPPRRFNVFRCFGPLARGPEFRKVLQGQATPRCLVFESFGPLAGGPESRRPLPMQSRPAIFESSEISARSPAERNIGRLLPCNAKPAPPPPQAKSLPLAWPPLRRTGRSAES